MKGLGNRQKREVQPKTMTKREIINFKKMNRELMKKIVARLEKRIK